MSDDIPPRPDGLWPAEEPPPETRARPQATWRWWEAVGVYLIGLLLVGFVTLPLFSIIRPTSIARLAVTVVGDLLLVGVLLLWLGRYHPRWREIIGFPRRVWLEVGWGVLYGSVLYVIVAFGAGLVLALLLDAVAGGDVRVPDQLPGNLGGGRVLLAIVLALVAAPISEELFFRGCLFRALRDRYGFAAGAAVSAVAFGLVHYTPGPWHDSLLLMGVMVFTGLGLAHVYERRGNIVACVVAHATFNLVGVSIILGLG